MIKQTLLTLAVTALTGTAPLFAQTVELVNVSYDPTRELYAEFSPAFAKYYKEKTGKTVKINTSHGGSGSQARAVIDGQPADVVTLALAGDIDAIAEKGKLLPADWQKSFPKNSSPYTSTIVLVVRKGNPKNIKDWDDLIRPDVSIITPNPKTSGGARWNYLAAWAYAHKKFGGDLAKTEKFVADLYKRVEVLDRAARGSTNTFGQRGIGDVFISWENEAFLLQKELPGQTEIIVPSLSILAEPPVAVVTRNAQRKKTTEVAEAFLEYLYSPVGQEIAGKHFYRPTDPGVAKKFEAKFPKLELVTIDDSIFGGWAKAQPQHFNDGGIFDKIYQPK